MHILINIQRVPGHVNSENRSLAPTFMPKNTQKPLFNSQQIMTVHNSYNFCCLTELFKIIKFRYPIALHQLLNFSHRSTSSAILLQQQSTHFLYQSSLKWNIVWKHLFKSETGYEIPLSSVKRKLKITLLNIQSLHGSDEWVPQNFILNSINLSQLEN